MEVHWERGKMERLVGRALLRRSQPLCFRRSFTARSNTTLEWWNSLPPVIPSVEEGEIELSLNGKSKNWPRGILPKDLPGKPKKAVAVTVENATGSHLNDLWTPLRQSGSLRWEPRDSLAGSLVLQHSAAHLVGHQWALRGAQLCHGPAVAPAGTGNGNGNQFEAAHFFYDAVAPPLTPSDVSALEELTAAALRAGGSVERREVPLEWAQRCWTAPHPKAQLLARLAAEGVATVTVYRVADSVDLCRGPHVPSVDLIHQIRLTHFGASQWHGQPTQRLFGIAFPSAAAATAWEEKQKERKLRDHRTIGQRQHLFFMHPGSPGQPFFLPNGTRIYHRLQELIRSEYRKRGYEEVITPQVLPQELWERSGHWEHYRADMFSVHEADGTLAGQLKPMNCPGHCELFAHEPRSHRDLPLRVAEFGVLHRCERRGTLSGLTRVRRFAQDDAHIFCAASQVADEIRDCLDFMKRIYGILGFEYDLELSTRPEGYMGELSEWEAAEEALRTVLRESNLPWREQPGEGAFYGPKIDVHIQDALQRRHQCATVQLDFQLPQRFELTFAGPNGPERPVLIHRAVLGSVERLLAVLAEHTAGRWPFWLAPLQCRVVPVEPAQEEAAQRVAAELRAAGFYVDCAVADGPLAGRVREATTAGVTMLAVMGARELPLGHVVLRHRDGRRLGTFSVAELIEYFSQLSRDFQ